MLTCANNIDAARELNKVRRSLREINNYLGLRGGEGDGEKALFTHIIQRQKLGLRYLFPSIRKKC